MAGDMLSNIDEFNFVLSSIRTLQQLYLPDHVIYEGDWNTYFFTFSFTASNFTFSARSPLLITSLFLHN